MANLTLRLVKGVPLTNAEVDGNFSNLNISKVEIGRDLSGNIYYPVVSGIQGRDVSNTTPSDAQVLKWSTSGNAWAPATISYDTLTNPPVANIILTGDVTGSANAVLTANSTIITISATTIQANSVALGTDTTGDYVANVLAGTGIVVTGQGGETASPTVALDVSGVTANTYGGSSKVPVLTIDQYGRVTAAANVNVAGVTSFAASGNSFTISTADGGSFTANIQQDSVRLGTDTTGNYVSTVTVGSGLTVTGTSDEGNVVTLSHLDTSAVGNVSSDNSNGNVIQDVVLGFDDFGHVTAASVVVANLDGRFLRLSSDTTQTITGNVAFNSNVSISETLITGNILPSANITYNLGSPTQRFKDLFLSGNTINLGAAVLSATGDSVAITSIDDTPIGATTRSTGAFTSLAANVLTANAIQGIVDTTLVTNLNADLLDSQQGIYYLDWTNQTNKPSLNVTFTGDVTGAGNVTLTNNNTNFLSVALTVQPNSVALGTDTTGNYVSTVTVGSGLTVTGTSDEGNVVTVAHADTSSVVNVSYDNSNGVVVQDVTLEFDTFGHVTTATVGTVDLDARYLRLSSPNTQIITSYLDFQGNVTFSGNVTTIGANNLVITDNFIYINDGTQNTNVDVGLVANYNDGTYAHTGIFRDASDSGTWKVFEGYLPEPDENVNIDTDNASFRLASFAAKDIKLTGNLIQMPGLSDVVGNTITLSTTTETTIHEFSATTYNSGKFTITGKQGSNVQISEFLVAHDGSVASGTEYGVVKTSGVTVFAANVDISGGNMKVNVIGTSSESTKYVLAGTQIYA